MRQKCVKNASEMRQMGLVLLGKEERPKYVRNPSKLRQKCVKNARNTFGGEHLLDDTDHFALGGEVLFQFESHFWVVFMIWGVFVGRTPKGAYSSRGRSRHLLETPFSAPLLRTLLRTLFHCKAHGRPPSENPSPEPFPEPSQNPSYSRCVVVRPLRRAPYFGVCRRFSRS